MEKNLYRQGFLEDTEGEGESFTLVMALLH